MTVFQLKPLTADEASQLGPLSRDLQAALSYIAFYSSDSPFVIQSVRKFHKALEPLLRTHGTLALYGTEDSFRLNGAPMPDSGELARSLRDHGLQGVQCTQGVTPLELSHWFHDLLSPVHGSVTAEKGISHIQEIPLGSPVEVLAEGEQAPDPIEKAVDMLLKPLPVPSSADLSLRVPPAPEDSRVPNLSLSDVEAIGRPVPAGTPSGDHTSEALLSFMAEAWQFSQLQKRSLGSGPETIHLVRAFDKLFERLLDRLERTSPDFANIYQWFRTPEGQLLEQDTSRAMFGLLEVAVRNDWTAVLYDPATEGLVGECLAHWGANGQHDLVEKAVRCLTRGLEGDGFEEQLALTHLMDSRPWIRNQGLVQEVLDSLVRLLGSETVPGLYQSALLLAWDLTEPALEAGFGTEVLSLLTTLHFQAEEDTDEFAGRASIARHWLYERSTPEMVRRFTYAAFEAGRLTILPLLGEMAAPLLVEDYFQASSAEDKASILRMIGEIREPARSHLSERLADAASEEDVRKTLPLLRASGIDPALSFPLAGWLSRGSRELKLNLLGLIEQLGTSEAGPALRLAVLDDSEEIASLAATVMGKIGFTQGFPLLVKAVKVREARFPENDAFLQAVCQAAGVLKAPGAMEFLQEIARKKSMFRGKNFSNPVRLAAVRALTKVDQPEVWSFLESLMDEKNPDLQQTLDQIIHEKIQSL